MTDAQADEAGVNDVTGPPVDDPSFSEDTAGPPVDDPSLAPTNPGFVAGATAGVVAFAAVAWASWLAAGAAAVGVLALALGAVRGVTGLVRGGALALAAGIVVAGVEGASPLAIGVGAWGAVVAWDAVGHALDVARQVGAASDDGVVLAHVRDVALVGALALGVAAAAFLAGSSEGATLAGVAGVAAVALVLALALD